MHYGCIHTRIARGLSTGWRILRNIAPLFALVHFQSVFYASGPNRMDDVIQLQHLVWCGIAWNEMIKKHEEQEDRHASVCRLYKFYSKHLFSLNISLLSCKPCLCSICMWLACDLHKIGEKSRQLASYTTSCWSLSNVAEKHLIHSNIKLKSLVQMMSFVA